MITKNTNNKIHFERSALTSSGLTVVEPFSELTRVFSLHKRIFRTILPNNNEQLQQCTF